MWIRKREYVDILTASHERGVRADMLAQQLEAQKDATKQYAKALKMEREKNALLSARVSELEKKLLELNDTLNALKQHTPAQPLDLAALYDDEDQEEVQKMRERIKKEGADLVLAEMMEKGDGRTEAPGPE